HRRKVEAFRARRRESRPVTRPQGRRTPDGGLRISRPCEAPVSPVSLLRNPAGLSRDRPFSCHYGVPRARGLSGNFSTSSFHGSKTTAPDGRASGTLRVTR